MFFVSLMQMKTLRNALLQPDVSISSSLTGLHDNVFMAICLHQAVQITNFVWNLLVQIIKFTFGVHTPFVWSYKIWVCAIIDYVVFCEIRQLWLTTICRLSANSTKNLYKSDVVYSSIKGLLHPPKYIFFDYSLTCVAPFWILPIERKQRTLFYIRLNARMHYFHSNQSVNTRRIRILALRRM